MAISPDGDHLYATSDSGDRVLLFRRLDGDGALQFLDAFDSSVPGMEGALLDGPDDVLVSANGAHVYVAARDSDAIAVFGRDPSTGQLSWLGNQVDGSGAVSGLDGVVALALSPDGDHLYAAGREAGAVAVFARDHASGALSFLEAERDAALGGGSAVDLEQPTALVVSPDGGQVYVASRSGNAVQTFARDPDSGSLGFGQLSFHAVARNGLDGITGLSGANGLAISADGAHLYALGSGSNSVVLFDRATDGSLVQRQHWASGSGVPGLLGPSAIALTGDGSELYVTGLDDHSLTIFRRADDGALSVRQTVFDDQGSVTSMGGPAALAISPDDRNVYVAANFDSAIVVFLRETFTGIFGDGFGDD
jgi:6-phosphogluconolactonase (cycloisomerase 2 family)